MDIGNGVTSLHALDGDSNTSDSGGWQASSDAAWSCVMTNRWFGHALCGTPSDPALLVTAINVQAPAAADDGTTKTD